MAYMVCVPYCCVCTLEHALWFGVDGCEHADGRQCVCVCVCVCVCARAHARVDWWVDGWVGACSCGVYMCRPDTDLVERSAILLADGVELIDTAHPTVGKHQRAGFEHPLPPRIPLGCIGIHTTYRVTHLRACARAGTLGDKLAHSTGAD